MYIKLNKKLNFEEKNIISDECGGNNVIWSLYKTIWGNISPISASNEFANYNSNTKINHVVTIRYLNKINENMRIKYNNRIFYIKSIVNVKEKNIYYEILCEENI